jgi:hypothetical protein
MSSLKPNYTKCAVIVHGKSELFLLRYIYTNLHLPVKIIANNNGSKSIQINGLLKFMQNEHFKCLKSFAKQYAVEYDENNKCLKDFKLFIIMDTDDCDEKTKDNYVSGKMFQGHIFEEYIVPIYNSSNLEDVLKKAGIIKEIIPDSQKGQHYPRIFPINQKPLSDDTKKEVETFATKIKTVKQTNMSKFIDYCNTLLQIQDPRGLQY